MATLRGQTTSNTDHDATMVKGSVVDDCQLDDGVVNQPNPFSELELLTLRENTVCSLLSRAIFYP